ncbi:hypothetical protein LSH36_128g00016 [Paralvinella palmiformis]|uniref:Uncharacterized protein n=1 Tax=Paralvinella palmiformis TaxID=53620 RepID=A0AAD9N8D8_9ANNE|nr:hypothetical protein LSH36_128g00016 [Paralvinella palmiformis]
MSSKPEDMYRSRFLRSIRTAENGADTFVCGRICAEIKKSTVYTVDIKLDICGVVQKSQFDGRLALKTDRIYIMDALMCTGRRWCDLVVWSRRVHKVVNINSDDQFISDMKEKLEDLFTQYFRSPVLNKLSYKL